MRKKKKKKCRASLHVVHSQPKDKGNLSLMTAGMPSISGQTTIFDSFDTALTLKKTISQALSSQTCWPSIFSLARTRDSYRIATHSADESDWNTICRPVNPKWPLKSERPRMAFQLMGAMLKATFFSKGAQIISKKRCFPFRKKPKYTQNTHRIK